jgi:phosphoribosylformylglycinamidine cyclo-ligase
LITDFGTEFNGTTMGETLLTPTKIYVKPVLKLLEQIAVKGMAHITGGGLIENLPRIIPDGLCANIDTASVRVLPIFEQINKLGVDRMEMFGTFNMGVGFCIVVNAADVNKTLEVLHAEGEAAYVVGAIVAGTEKICFK